MKRMLLLILVAILPRLAHGQQPVRLFDRNHYLLDTFRFHDTQVLKQRYSQEYLAPFLNSYQKSNDELIAYNIDLLQAQLDQMGRYIIEAKDVFYNVQNGRTTMSRIHELDTAYDLRRYQQEMDFYKKIADDRYNEKEDLRKKAEQEKANELARAQAEKQRIADSISDVEAYQQQVADMIQAAADEKEAKQLAKAVLKKYGPVNGKAINNGKVLLGMTPDMCILAWGKPGAITKSTTAKGVVEKWVYSKLEFIIFKNGRVAAINEGGTVGD